jgi:hypothetical protein
MRTVEAEATVTVKLSNDVQQVVSDDERNKGPVLIKYPEDKI